MSIAELSPAPASLDQRLVSSVAWTAAAKWGSQILSWACFLLVARLVSVRDFGLITMASAFLGVFAILGEFGISSTVVNLRRLDREQLRQLNGLSFLVGVSGFLVIVLVAHPMAMFFRAPELIWMAPVMGVGLVFTGIRGVPQGLLQRDLRFKLISGIEATQMCLQAGVTVALALLGRGYWALVLGALSGNACASLLPLIWSRPGFALPNWRHIASALRFSRAVTISSVCWYAYSNADFVVGGRMLGKAALGAYSMAWTLATLPAEKLASLVLRVMPGFLSNSQSDLPALRRYLCRVTEIIALVTIPAAIAIALTAAQFVPAVLGNRWRPAIVPLILLSMYGAMSSVCAILPPVLNAVGRPESGMWNALLKLLVLPPAFWVATRWGAAGIAAAWVCLYPLLSIPLLTATLRALELPLRRYLASLIPALSCSAAVVACVLLAGAIMPQDSPEWSRFAVKAVAALAGFAGGLVAFHPDLLRAYGQKIREAR